ncbi:MAG: type II toxin-antitoxin system prevent-host-death family antitoxin, partial [Chloroflexi bacterium]|nr:type II toxin-antitoxin system prevent-host-death family antitoxin [Chloroflexota bacterium]
MVERSVGIRELKNRLSKYLRAVKAGQTILITDRGRPVGRLIP